MRDALMATVAEVFDKAKEKTSANKDIIYKDIATGTKPGRKSRPAVMHGARRVRSACADGRLQPSWAALRCGRCVVWPSMRGNSLPTQASSRRSTSNTRRWTTRRRAACTTASWAPTSPALSRMRRTSPATSPATTSAQHGRERPSLQAAPQPGSSGSSVGSAGWRAALRTRGQSPGRPNLHKALCAASPRRIACLSAARRTRHDPLECPGLHAWPAAVWPLRRGRSCRSHRATTPHPHHAGEPSHLQVKGLALRLRPPPKARGEGLRCVLCGVGCLNIVTSENSRTTNAAERCVSARGMARGPKRK